jgi:molybdopterin converting factor subunit 1
MKVPVKMFAVARQLTESDVVELELPAGATVAELRECLAEQFPALKQIIDHVLFAVGAEYATDATLIKLGVEVACIPPVSGG